MIELISILASIGVLILTPIQTKQILAGHINKKYKLTREDCAAAFSKQLWFLFWLAPIFAVLNLTMIFIASEPGEWVVKLVAAALWLGVLAVTFFSRQKLAGLLTPSPS
ncbi:MAG TPA: hypothetical protein VGL35_09110 [Rhizomicrobium sp.]